MLRVLKMVLIVCLMFFCCDKYVMASEITDVKNTFNVFYKALKAKDGVKVVENVSDSLLSMVEKCRKLALTPGKINTTNLMQVEVNAIMVMRYIFSKEQLESMTAHATLVAGVSSGVIQKNALKSLVMTKGVVDGKTARFGVIRNGNLKGGMIFKKENGIWKVEVVKTLRLLERQFKLYRKKTGKSKVDVSLELLKNTLQVPVSKKIITEPIG